MHLKDEEEFEEECGRVCAQLYCHTTAVLIPWLHNKRQYMLSLLRVRSPYYRGTTSGFLPWQHFATEIVQSRSNKYTRVAVEVIGIGNTELVRQSARTILSIAACDDWVPLPPGKFQVSKKIPSQPNQ